MASIRKNLILSIVGLFFLPAAASAQKNTGINLFQTNQNRSSELIPAPAAIDTLIKSKTTRLTGIPMLNGKNTDFDFEPTETFSSDAKIYVMKADGTSETLSLPPIRTWNGSDPSDLKRKAFLSLNQNNQIRIFISGDSNTSSTVIEPTSATDTAVSVKAVPPAPNAFCSLERPPVGGKESLEQTVAENAAAGRALTDDIYELELSLDITKQLYDKLVSGGITPQEYVTNLIGASNTIFRRDLGLLAKTKILYIWDTPQPFTDDIAAYRSWVNTNRAANSYDLTHQLGYNPSEGGIAYLNVISSTSSYRVGISHVHGENLFPTNQSTYYWDTVVFAHELGHNLGSDHTHCFVPPIDCCYVDPDCSGCSVSVPAAGTIMSYCHLKMNSGGYIKMEFHSRCIDVIRPKITVSPYLSKKTKQADIVITGKHNPVTAGSSIATAVNGTVFGPGVPATHNSDRTFTITNNGNLNLNLTGPNPVSLSATTHFSIISQPASLSLAPGESTDFKIRFSPQAFGVQTATVSVKSGDPDTPTFSYAIEGKGTAPGAAQTFSSTQGYYIHDTWGAELTINVSGVMGKITDIEFHLPSVSSGCSTPVVVHDNLKDLRLIVRSPGGTEVTIFQYPGTGSYSGANICQARFTDDAGFSSIQNITSASAPHSGTYNPYEPIRNFTGENPNGTWQVFAYDDGLDGDGILYKVALKITGENLATVKDWSVY